MPAITIHYDSFPSPADLPDEDRQLLAAADEATRHSYSPYSNFRVGAAARLADGTIARGWNTENAAYPMCICAEPAALAAAAGLRPGMAVATLAITVRAPNRVIARPASPCGSCRQQLTEHEGRFGHRMRLILRGEEGPVYVFASAADLLPLGFNGGLVITAYIR